ncbi:hypothetical protein LF65_05412 [Clostridium beijerinckii]|uniref:Spo0E like sporulation regulatory protein n=1 Tax=Clostridium beijerinckii TaxID=1520 RepID=A0A0B5QY61_CLOBE|nr:hypothetical protein [Clostridium beijerinckii]AJH01929.1 hypothetical protein LF65_05412 [Clostridium beijerinckii]
MDKVKDIFTIENKLENLREKLNKDTVRNMEYKSKEGYESLLDISRELDNVIIHYIKSVNK